MSAIPQAKALLRTAAKQRLSLVSSVSIEEQSAIAAKATISLNAYKTARRIGIFLSMPESEIETMAIAKDAIERNKQVFVPFIPKAKRTVSGRLHDRSMDMVALHDLQDLEACKHNRDAWGIPCPTSLDGGPRSSILGSTGRTQPDSQSLDVIILPGLIFDDSCGRLGHGKGFYDHFLGKLQQSRPENQFPHLVGLALQEQMLPAGERVPIAQHDWNMDYVVTGHGVLIKREK